MKFIAFNPFVKQLRSDKGFRVEFDVSEDQYNQIKDLPMLQEITLIITVEEEK